MFFWQNQTSLFYIKECTIQFIQYAIFKNIGLEVGKVWRCQKGATRNLKPKKDRQCNSPKKKDKGTKHYTKKLKTDQHEHH